MIEPVPNASQQQQRVIRVFVSSTFRDMHAERDELIKRVFPQLRKLCDERAVTWSEVDLRWGITEEQSQRGEVLPICLAEIQRCRPYFIGLLGERYGWVPDEIPQEIIEREPWLAEHLHQSVTELEILHGVLNNPKMADQALFYFRDPAYAESQPGDKQPDFLELPTDEDIAKYGEQEAARRAEERRQKLALLKERIRQSGLPVRENYTTPQAVGEMVLQDMKAIIEHLYPEGSEPDALDRDALEHEAFAQSRAKVYIGRQEYYDRLDEHARGGGPPLVVLGESGSGKSALLANWALQYRNSHPEELLLMHFIGATPYSTDWAAMLRRIIGEFARRFGIEQEIPDQPGALRSAFANWLRAASARGKIVLLLDALNQLEDRDGALEIVWLPPEIPPNIRLIVSTLPGRALDVFHQRGWPTLSIQALSVQERTHLIGEYLGQYRKTLSPNTINRIVGAGQTKNPLFLRALLDELRVYGDYATLDRRIEHYLSAATIPELYEKVLERYEEDYERDRPALVQDAMSLLWAARRGISETELLEALNRPGQPLPRAFWSPLQLAAKDALVERSGLIGLSHAYFREAIRPRYLGSTEKESRAFTRLANYFTLSKTDGRRIEELPWALSRARDWERLCDLLSDPEFFVRGWEHSAGANQFEVKRLWASIEESSPLRMAEAYKNIIENPGVIKDKNLLLHIALLIRDSGMVKEAILLLDHLMGRSRIHDPDKSYATILTTLSTCLLDNAEIERAFSINVELRRLWQKLENDVGVAVCEVNQGTIWRNRGELSRAVRLFENAATALRSNGRTIELADCLGKLADTHTLQGNAASAAKLLDEKEGLHRAAGDFAGLAHCLNARGVIALQQGDLDQALRYHSEEQELCRLQGDRVGLQRALGSRALILQQQGRALLAETVIDEATRICREIANDFGLACCLGVRGRILRDLGRLEEARVCQEEEEVLCRGSGNLIQLATSLFEQSVTAGLAGARSRADELRRQSLDLLEHLDLGGRWRKEDPDEVT